MFGVGNKFKNWKSFNKIINCQDYFTILHELLVINVKVAVKQDNLFGLNLLYYFESYDTHMTCVSISNIWILDSENIFLFYYFLIFLFSHANALQ